MYWYIINICLVVSVGFYFSTRLMFHVEVLHFYVDRCIISSSIFVFFFAFMKRPVLIFLPWGIICIFWTLQILSVQLDVLHLCTYPHNHHPGQDTELFHPPRGSLGPLPISCSHPRPQELTTVLTSIIDALICSWLSNNRITRYMFFLLQPSFILRFSHVIYVVVLFLNCFIDSIVWIWHNLYFGSPVDRCLGCW